MDWNKAFKEEELREYYDSVFSKGDIRDNEKLYHWIIKLLAPEPKKKFLDVACGIGWMLYAAEKVNLKTFGVDISPNAVEKAKSIAPNSEIIAGSGERLPWPDESFDYVTSLGSLEHYLNPDIGLREIYRVLKKDGLCAIMLPNKYQFKRLIKVLFKGDAYESPGQIIARAMSKGEWRRFLEEGNLKVEKIYKYNKYPELFKPGTWKLKSIRKFLDLSFVRYFAPFNFAFGFVYICKK